MTTVASLSADLSINTSRFEQGLQSASNTLKKNQAILTGYTAGGISGFSGMQKALIGFVAGLGLLAAAKAAVDFGEFIKGQIDSAKQIEITAERLGLTTTQLQEYQFAAKGAGIDSETFERGVTKLNASIASGKTPYKNTNEAILAIANQVQNAKTKVQQLAIVNDNFGVRMGAKMLPLLLQGADGLKALGAEALKTGNVLDSETIQSTKKLGEALEQLESTVSKNFSKGFLTELVGGTNDFKKIMDDPAFEQGIKNIGKAIGDLAIFALNSLTVLGKLVGTLQVLYSLGAKDNSGQTTSYDDMVYNNTANAITNPAMKANFLKQIAAMKAAHSGMALQTTKANAPDVQATKDNAVGIDTGSGVSKYLDPKNGIADDEKIKNLKNIFAGLDKENAALTTQNSLYGQQQSYIDAAVKSAEVQATLAKDGIVLTKQQTDELNKKIMILQQQKQLQEDEKLYQSEIKGLTGQIESGFEDAILGGKKLRDVFGSLMLDIEKIMLKKNVLDQLFGNGEQGSTGLLTGAISGLGDLIGLHNPLAGLASHATGQASVPYDMNVRVHKGERIDTAQDVRNGQVGGNVTLNITNTAGADVTAKQSASGNGNITLDVMVDRSVAKNVGSRGSATNKALSDFTQRTLVRR